MGAGGTAAREGQVETRCAATPAWAVGAQSGEGWGLEMRLSWWVAPGSSCLEYHTRESALKKFGEGKDMMDLCWRKVAGCQVRHAFEGVKTEVRGRGFSLWKD